jgi:hypothetical protein
MTRAFARVPQQRPLSIFLFLLCVFSGCTYALDVHSHHLSNALAQFTTWCPGFAALCTCLLVNGFVGFQLYEDGTTLSVWLLRLASGGMGVVGGAVAPEVG